MHGSLLRIYRAMSLPNTCVMVFVMSCSSIKSSFSGPACIKFVGNNASYPGRAVRAMSRTKTGFSGVLPVRHFTMPFLPFRSWDSVNPTSTTRSPYLNVPGPPAIPATRDDSPSRDGGATDNIANVGRKGG